MSANVLRSSRRLGFAAIFLVALVVSATRGEAHKPITSKYTYNDDVFPILRERCSRCHVPGGVAPMSLMTYEEAFPWAESIRAELVAAHMPPAAPDQGFGDVARAHALSPKETDIILTWASGGNPRGALDQKLPAVELKNDWSLGKPDLALPLPAPFTLAADSMEETREFTLPTGTSTPRWVRAIDLLPGTPAIVRSAVIVLKGVPERVLARWQPGQDATPLADGAAYRLPAGAELVARIRYKKTWSYEGKPMTDRSTIGVYFAPDGGAREVATLPIVSADVPARGAAFSFAQTLDQDVDALALSPDQVPDDLTLQVEAIKPDGSRTPLVRFVTRADWIRRYPFAAPIALPRGTRIQITGTVEDPDLTSAAFGGPTAPQKQSAPAKIRLALDAVRGDARPSAP
jgi:hypothetical protein